MEGHQAGQEEMLMEVKVKADSLEAIHRPGGSPADHRGCSKCRVALGAVVGLVIGALVTGFVLHFLISPAPGKQDALLTVATPVNTTLHHPRKNDTHGGYDIYTVDKAGTYLIYGWVKFSDVTNDMVTLWQTLKESKRTLQTITVNDTVIFFFCKTLLVNGARISIHSKSTFADSLFHVHKL